MLGKLNKQNLLAIKNSRRTVARTEINTNTEI